MRLVFAILLFFPTLHGQTVPSARIRSAAERSVAMIQQGNRGFYRAMICFSCHDHGLPVLTLKMARERGIPVNETSASEVAAAGLTAMPDFTSIDRAVHSATIVDPAVADGWALISAHAAGIKPNLVAEVYARRIANWQRADGSWPTTDDRPPAPTRTSRTREAKPPRTTRASYLTSVPFSKKPARNHRG